MTPRRSRRPRRSTAADQSSLTRTLLRACDQALTDIQTVRLHALEADVGERVRKRIEYTLAPSVRALQDAIAAARRAVRSVQP